jgi:acyl carrier protein
MSSVNNLNELKSDIRSIVQDAINSSGVEIELTDDVSLIDSGLLDSLSIVYVVQSLQDRFEIELDFADITLEHFDSVTVISELIAGRFQENG